MVILPMMLLFLVAAWTLSPPTAAAQEARWMNAGSLQNWYSAIGNEREYGLVSRYQFGLRWPAILENQDAQAAKAFWIGVRNFDDGENSPFGYKVIHAGPRVLGNQSFFPREFALHSRYEAPEVLVNDRRTVRGNVDPQIDVVDPGLPADRMLRNTVETALGLTFTREIHQFSQQYHDNYHILEYTIVNETGTYRDIPEQTLDSVYFYFQFRYAPVYKSRYMVANHTGWGRNTMNDRWGDGLQGQSHGEPFSDDGPPMRAAYAWHGHEPSREIDYNNIGAPQIQPNTAQGLMSSADTLGHLLAHHFVGHATLHADTSPTDPTDDLQQPRTRGHVNSDDDLKSGNDPFNRIRMQREYELMTRGIMPRHAYQVHQTATEFMNFADQVRDPRLGTSGGMSAMKAYGPYTLEPGDTIRIVWAEGVAGLSREMAEKVGERFKAHYEGRKDDARGPLVDGTTGEMTTRAKNEWVMTGRDSLLQTFERAMANYRSGYSIPLPPSPPARLELTAFDNVIELIWDFTGDERDVSGFAIYRGVDSFEAHHQRIAVLEPSARSFIDNSLQQGRDYYYYIASVGLEDRVIDAGRTPDGILQSSRYYTQTWDPISTLTDTGTGDEDAAPYAFTLAQNYPNPFNPATNISFTLPEASDVRLDVFDVTGRRVTVLVDGHKSAGHHNVSFDAGEMSSGIYLYRLQTDSGVMNRKMTLIK